MSKKLRGFIDDDSDDDDFEPKKTKPLKKRTAVDADGDDFASKKQKKRKLKDEASHKTSTQDKVGSKTTTTPGRGGRPTARMSAEEVRFQEELQMALRVSSEEDVGGGAASNEDVHVVKPADKKKAGLGVVNEGGSMVLGDSDDEEAAPAHCPNSASTVVLDDDGEEVEERGDREDILLEDSEGDEKETEIAMDVKKLNKSKKSETWIVGESRGRRSSGDCEKRNRRRPKKYVESSDSEDDLEGVINSDESDEEFEEKKKKSKPKKCSSKMPIKSPANRNIATKNVIENPAREEKQDAFEEKQVLAKKSVEPTHHQVPPGSTVRPLGIHNPSSPSRPSLPSTPATTIKLSAPSTPSTPTSKPSAPCNPASNTPTPSLSLPALLKLKNGGIGSKPSSPILQRGPPAWKPPAKVGSSSVTSSSIPASPGISPGLRRLGLSRNFRSPTPLHKNLKLSQ